MSCPGAPALDTLLKCCQIAIKTPTQPGPARQTAKGEEKGEAPCGHPWRACMLGICLFFIVSWSQRANVLPWSASIGHSSQMLSNSNQEPNTSRPSPTQPGPARQTAKGEEKGDAPCGPPWRACMLGISLFFTFSLICLAGRTF